MIATQVDYKGDFLFNENYARKTTNWAIRSF